jgi:glutathione S-transferase
MKLFWYPGYCSLASHIALREAGAEFTLEKIDLDTGITDAGRRYRDVNPAGHIAALEFGPGDVLGENVAVLLWIAERYPAAKLGPPPQSRAHHAMVSWLSTISTEIHVPYIWLYKPDFGDGAKAMLKARMDSTVDRIEARLATQPTLLGGPDPSVADWYFFVTMTWASPDDPAMAARPAVNAFMDRLRARPAAQAAMAAEGLT